LELKIGNILNKDKKAIGPRNNRPGRFAVYYAPTPFSELHSLGSAWLGRDSITGKIIEQPSVFGITSERLSELTKIARHYGFHATFKPPFQLKYGTKLTLLKQTLRQVCRDVSPFCIKLDVRRLGTFFALMLSKPNPNIQSLAEFIVREIDAFREPITKEELAIRRSKGLTPPQDKNLITWGYPYLFSEFQFHMTLTGKIQLSKERTVIYDALQRHFSDLLNKNIKIEYVCLFHQTNRQAPFFLVDQFKLGLK
tara:strand:+ start:2227 stop:2985 length:759 start_codon:yes stop_codon:yes gene_type:complete